MARNCNCSGSTCGCKITAGTGISIAGIGTAANPFVITNTGATLAAAFAVSDTTTLDMVKTGSGTNVDPVVISGNVTLKLQQLTDVSNPGGNPTAGQVPTYVGVSGVDGHWEFLIPSGGGGGAVSSVAGRTGAVVLTKADVGLSNVDNTSDLSKPVSTATAAAISAATPTLASLGGAPLNNPTFTGVPNAPTAANGTNTTQLATTAFVHSYVAAQPVKASSVNGVPVDSSGNVAIGIGDIPGLSEALANIVALDPTTGDIPFSILPDLTNALPPNMVFANVETGGAYASRATIVPRTDMTVLAIGPDMPPTSVMVDGRDSWLQE